jgi:hypothetical protein
MLFDTVKAAPLSARVGFPEVLRNNNFGLTLRVTNSHAFLEVTTKLRANRARDAERLQAYRQIFTSKDSRQPAVFAIDGSRFIRFSGFTAEAPHAFALGSNFSMCAWDIRSRTLVEGRPRSFDIDVLYVVGFGRSIPAEEAWQEFDALIRVTLSDWGGVR